MINFYKPNKANKGSAASFRLAAGQSSQGDKFREGCVFVSIVNQTAWNEKAHMGSFKGGDTTLAKLNLNEIGKMVSVLERGGKFDTYHKGLNQSQTILFSPWQDKNTGEQLGYGMRIVRERNGEKSTFQIGFQFGDDIELREFLKLAMQHIMLANYAEEKRKYKAAKSAVEVNPQEEAANNELVDEVESLFS